MARREIEQHRSPQDVPPVGRPRGAVWRALQADGVVWEGQVLLVGDDVDLAARMIVTHRRVAFVRGGDITLEIPREWLRPEPVLRRDGVLDLFVTTPGSNLFDEPTTVPLRVREGPAAAGHIIAMLAPGGVRRILPETLSGMDRAREAAQVPDFKGFWDGDDFDAPWDAAPRHAAHDHEGDAPRAESLAGRPPIEPPDRVVRAPAPPPRNPQTPGYGIAGLKPRASRKSPWILLLRLAGLALLLATAAALGAGRLDLGGFGGNSGAILAGPSPTVPAVASPSPPPPEAAFTAESQTAVAIGVGGGEDAPTGPHQPDSAAQVPTETLVSALASPSPRSEAPAASAPVATPAAPAAPAPEATPPPSTADTPSSQPPTIGVDAPPAQEMVVGALRVTIVSAERAETLPRYGLPPGSGEWVVLTVDVRNEGDAPANLAMSDFRLYDRESGVTIPLDSGTNVIARLAGFDPARSPADAIGIAPGASAAALLLFLLPPGASGDIAFLVGNAAMDLAPVLAAGPATIAAPPTLRPAAALEALDGGRLLVNLDGAEETVRYLGLQAPVAEDCFAAEAASFHRGLVGGQTVWLEREATDRGDDGALLRDVWILDEDGNRSLVAARLLEAGAGRAAPAPPDTRYQAWLQAAEALARTNGAGLWGACPDVAGSARRGECQGSAGRLAPRRRRVSGSTGAALAIDAETGKMRGDPLGGSPLSDAAAKGEGCVRSLDAK